MNTQKILIAGVGGVGGVLAGQLIKAYGDQVTLIARGKRKEHFQTQGLTIDGELYGQYTVHPACVVEDASNLPVQDIIFVCTKNDALEQILSQIAPAIGPDTLVMSVMNGVTAGSRIRAFLTQGHALESVIYTVSSSGPDYTVKQLGGYTRIFAGSVDEDQAGNNGTQKVVDLLSAAGIESHYSENVQASCWTKYILNCAYNVVTARHGITIGQIKQSSTLRVEYRTLMEEAKSVADARGITLPDDLVDQHMALLDRTNDASTSSLSRDFDHGIIGEMEVFSGDLIRMADEKGVDVPITRDYYVGLKERAAKF